MIFQKYTSIPSPLRCLRARTYTRVWRLRMRSHTHTRLVFAVLLLFLITCFLSVCVARQAAHVVACSAHTTPQRRLCFNRRLNFHRVFRSYWLKQLLDLIRKISRVPTRCYLSSPFSCVCLLSVVWYVVDRLRWLTNAWNVCACVHLYLNSVFYQLCETTGSRDANAFDTELFPWHTRTHAHVFYGLLKQYSASTFCKPTCLKYWKGFHRTYSPFNNNLR